MSKLYPIASGSSGNCTYISHGDCGILVDAGVSAKAISDGLRSAAVEPESVRAIFITHEHIDHVGGLKNFVKKYRTPIFATPGTLSELIRLGAVSDGDCLFPVGNGVDFGCMTVKSFPTSHDTAEPCGYTVTFENGVKCSVCTDLGFVSDAVHGAIDGSTAILLECNHDLNMLKNGKYPEYLKRRIMSNVGHLSNNSCAAELCRLVKSGAKKIVLGHLSRENNEPETARSAVTAALVDEGFFENEDYTLYIAPPKNGKAVLF